MFLLLFLLDSKLYFSFLPSFDCYRIDVSIWICFFVGIVFVELISIIFYFLLDS